MRHTMVLGLMVMVAAGCAAHEKASERPLPPPVVAAAAHDTDGGVFREQAIQVTARVQAIDQKTRIVTLRGPEGNVFDVHAGAEVKNLAQVHAGDDVVITYYESVAITVHKPGEKEPMIETSVDVSRAKPGETPAASDVQRTTVVATVLGTNKREGTITVKGPRGKVRTVAVRDPSKLEGVAIGDLIQLVYTEAAAIAVEKPTGGGKKIHGGAQQE